MALLLKQVLSLNLVEGERFEKSSLFPNPVYSGQSV